MLRPDDVAVSDTATTRRRLRELSVSRVDKIIKTTREQNGVAVAKLTRTVLSGVLGLAARHDAIRGNLVRDAAPIRSEGKMRTSLDLAELQDLRAKLAADQRAVYLDLPDLIDFMAATGLRIGEALAVRWQALDLDLGTVEVQATIVRIKGKGVALKENPKSKAGWRVIELPSWSVDMLRRRRRGAVSNIGTPSSRLRAAGFATPATLRATCVRPLTGRATRRSPHTPCGGRWPR